MSVYCPKSRLFAVIRFLNKFEHSKIFHCNRINFTFSWHRDIFCKDFMSETKKLFEERFLGKKVLWRISNRPTARRCPHICACMCVCVTCVCLCMCVCVSCVCVCLCMCVCVWCVCVCLCMCVCVWCVCVCLCMCVCVSCVCICLCVCAWCVCLSNIVY